MNNRFKFRFWCSSENRFITDCVIHGDGKISVKTGICGRDYCHDVVIQQYTGLNDKNGEEIYEGDIVKDTWKETQPYSYSPDEEYDREEIFEVKYKDYSFNLDRKYNREQTCVDDFHREVIGNIFEHSELLK